MKIPMSTWTILYLCLTFMVVSSSSDKKTKVKTVQFDPCKALEFSIYIHDEEWKSIQPITKKYTDRWVPVLQEGWTDLILDKVCEKYDLECQFSMDRHKFYKRKGYPFFQFVGKCDECGAPITGTIHEKPDEFPYCIVIETFDTRGIRHIYPRQLRNKKREEIREKARYTKPLKLRHQIANECLDDDGNLKTGGQKRPNLNSTAVYSKLRYEIKKIDTKDYSGDSISELINLKLAYPDYIRLFSTVPVVLYYWSRNQLDFWNEIAPLGFSISIDASGKFVRPLQIIEGQKSSPIFFYNVTVRMLKKVYSLSQMLSSKHDVGQISSWLSKWIKSGAAIPKEAVVDCAYALLNSVCISFNHCTFEEYLTKCIQFLLGYSNELPICNVKRDTAHLIKAMSVWNCFKNDGWMKKDFYLRVICFSLEIEDFNELREVIVALFVVCQNQSKSTQYLESKELLDTQIGTFDHKVFYNKDKDNCADCTPENCCILHETDDFVRQTNLDDSMEQITCKKFILQLKAEADILLQQDKAKDSTEVNPYFMLSIIPNLRTLCSQFPAWTNVMHPFYTFRPNKVSTSCGSEVYYRITTIDYGFSSPMSMKKYILEQMPLIDGATKIARRMVTILLERIKKQNEKNKKSSIKSNETVADILTDIMDNMSQDIESNNCLGHKNQELCSNESFNKNIKSIDNGKKRKTSEDEDDDVDKTSATKNKKIKIFNLSKIKYIINLKEFYYNLPYLRLSKLTLTVDDLKSLDNRNLVSGNVIDSFMIIKLKKEWKNISIIPTSQTTFIVGDQCSGNHHESWEMYHLNYNFSGLIFVPYCFDCHWCLIVLDPINETAIHYDPLYDKPKERHDYEIAFQTFLDQCPDSHILKNKNWKWIDRRINVPRQRDGWNCGVFVMFVMTIFANAVDSSIRSEKFNPKTYRPIVADMLIKDEESNSDICLYCYNDKYYDYTTAGIKKCETCDRWAHIYCLDKITPKLKEGKCELCLDRLSKK